MRYLILLILVCAGPVVLSSQTPRQLLPVDEAATQPDFFAFRAELITAVARRDAAAILAVVDPDVRNSFGGDDGIEGFRKKWRLEEPDSGFWQEFGTVLALGGTFEGPDRFVAPYTFARWPDGVDSFEHLAVVGSGVSARAAPRDDLPAMARVDFAIVRMGPGGYVIDSAPWQGVVLPDGRQAHVRSDSVRSPIDYRASFMRRQGTWRLLMFLAGD